MLHYMVFVATIYSLLSASIFFVLVFLLFNAIRKRYYINSCCFGVPCFFEVVLVEYFDLVCCKFGFKFFRSERMGKNYAKFWNCYAALL